LRNHADFLCIGNAIVDVYADVDSAFPDQTGISSPVQHIPPQRAREIVSLLGAYTLRPGGGAANAARVSAGLGCGAVFCGAVGGDEFGSFFSDELVKAGVIPALKIAKNSTGLCLILNNGTETRIAASPSAALEFDETDVNENDIRSAGMIIVDGYMLGRKKLINRIFRIADEAKIPVGLDAASVPIIQENAAAVLRYCRDFKTALFMNADESIAFFRAVSANNELPDIHSETEKKEFIFNEMCPVLEKVVSEDNPIIVIKLGEKGALAIAGEKTYRAETQPINTQNTTGAGDAFCAAFLKEWRAGKSIPECLRQGNRIAGELIIHNS